MTVNSAQAIALTPTTLTFPNTRLESQSLPQAVTVTNTGYDDVTINKVIVVGDFIDLSPDFEVIKPGESVQLWVAFRPYQIGQLSGGLYIDTGDAAGQEFVSLSGSCVPNGGVLPVEETEAFIYQVGDPRWMSRTEALEIVTDIADQGLTAAGALRAANNLNDVSNKATARSNLGLEIGKDVAAATKTFRINSRTSGATLDLSGYTEVIANRWTDASPLAPALYTKTEAIPDHAAWFQDSQGNIFAMNYQETVSPRMFGGTDGTAINRAISFAAAYGGGAVLCPAGQHDIDTTITILDGVTLVVPPKCTLKRAASFAVGAMILSKDFALYTGTTDATAPYPRYVGLVGGGTIDGGWMTDTKDAYLNDTNNNGVMLYSHIRDVDIRIQNVAGVGCKIESSRGGGVNNLGYPRGGTIRVNVESTKYESIIMSVADIKVSELTATESGNSTKAERGTIASPVQAWQPRNSLMYPGKKVDGIVFDIGAEVVFLHSWGHISGEGIRVDGGRLNGWLIMSESNRFGGVTLAGEAFGQIEQLDIHRSGGYPVWNGSAFVGDTKPMLTIDGGDANAWKLGCNIYHDNTASTTPRNLVEITGNAKHVTMSGYFRGGNVPGHGIVIEDGAGTIRLDGVHGLVFVGMARDGLPASFIYRKASSATRNYFVRGTVATADCAFRALGVVTKEVIDLDCYLSTGQVMFAGDVRSNPGQDWNIRGTINGVFKGSRNEGASAPFVTNVTTEQDIVIPHGLIATPAFGRYKVDGIVDSGTAMGVGAAIQWMYATSADDTNIYAKVKLSSAMASDTAPRLLWSAKI